ncbi:MAG: murein DD-endopeptidase MepM/ murein hydrolase activator NlpD [Flavobacteriales bacterium]|jgi:murein DD-endopeptidase MepM/ murein hydrolase activator NlpD
MMVELNEEQIELVAEQLTEQGLNYVPLETELLDHVCCMIEEQMQNGKLYEEASKTVFEFFGKDELKNLQEQTISLTNKKSSFMKNLVLAILAFLLIPSSLVFYSNSERHHFENAIQAPSPQEMLSMQDHLAETDIADPPSIKPLKDHDKINSGFGDRFHPIFKKKVFHKGIDFKAPLGTPVLATSDGVVEFARDGKKHGLYILLKHDENFHTKYSHLSKLKVKEGETVKKGTVIGLVGSTGTSSGPHLHYEVIKNGKAVNPVDYFNP